MRACPAVAALLATAVLGCGGDDEENDPRLVVSAAASMSDALRECASDFGGADVRLSLAGSDELAAQIRRGVRPDVYAAANTELPGALRREGLLGEPVRFATNELVIAVPRSSNIRRLSDLTRASLKLVVGSASAPVGSYTRRLLERLPRAQRRQVLANVRSTEPNVRGIVGKLVQGAADGGFVYRTDAAAASGRLRAVGLPARLRPRVVYAAGVVSRARRPSEARRFVRGLVRGGCARALRRAGFGEAP